MAEEEVVLVGGGRVEDGGVETATAEDEDPTAVEVEIGGILPSGKLSFALNPRNLVAATSYAIAASSAVSKVPSHTRAAFFGSRISAAHFPHGRCLTPRYLLFLIGAALEVAIGVDDATAELDESLTETLSTLSIACCCFPAPLPSPTYPPPTSPCSKLLLRICVSAKPKTLASQNRRILHKPKNRSTTKELQLSPSFSPPLLTCPYIVGKGSDEEEEEETYWNGRRVF